MPNGRPGDHPYTDIVRWDADIYNGRIRKHVRRVSEYDDEGARKQASSLLWETPEDSSPEEMRELRANLRSLAGAVEDADDYSVPSPYEGCMNEEETVYTERIRTLVRDIDEELAANVDNYDRARRLLSALLWKFGWDPEDLDALEGALREFGTNHWIWEH